MRTLAVLSAALALAIAPVLQAARADADEPAVSGPQQGERVGAFGVTAATGPDAGTNLCYI